jgi:hypothetical protein
MPKLHSLLCDLGFVNKKNLRVFSINLKPNRNFFQEMKLPLMEKFQQELIYQKITKQLQSPSTVNL